MDAGSGETAPRVLFEEGVEGGEEVGQPRLRLLELVRACGVSATT